MKILLFDRKEEEQTSLNLLRQAGYNDVFLSCDIENLGKVIDEVKPNILIAEYKYENGKHLTDYLSTKTKDDYELIIYTNEFSSEVYDEIPLAYKFQYVQKSDSYVSLKQAIEYAYHANGQFKELKSAVTDKFYVKIGDKFKIISMEEIQYFEVDGKYLNIYLESRKYSIRSSLTDLLHRIPQSKYMRVHGSFVINLDKVMSINPTNNSIELKNHKIPFSRNYKKELLNHFAFV